FGAVAWLAALAVVLGLGFAGELGINQVEQAIQNFSARWITRLFGGNTDPSQSITSMGQIGRLKLSAKIVVWITPGTPGHPPTYLREASYRTYGDRNETWFVGGPRNDFEHLYPEPDNSSWLLVTGRQATATANITCYLNGRTREGDPEGLLPLPSGCCQLANLPMVSSVIELRKNKTGAVLATGAGLMVFDARYGPGATLDSPPDTTTNHLDLLVPTNEVPALKQVIAEMNLTNADYTQTLRAVRKFFYNNFTYSVWQGKDQMATANASPLTRFLLTTHRGHCEYFATATVLLLRELGIPARYAVGYYVHEPRGKGYVVRERDSHAWCLVWNQATKTWEDFDTTPPSWVAIESARASSLEWLEDLGSWIGLQIERFRWRQAHLQQYIFAALLPVMAVLLYYILFKHRRKQKDSGQSRKRQADIFRPGLDSEFYLLERKLAARGVARPPGEPLSNWLERLMTDPALAGQKSSLQELLRLHYCYRFDPRGLNVQERETLASQAKACLDKLSQRKQNSERPA
ncbi:MAG TPA: transglutaminase domain-containing protein, partial [Verrucomicrobiae bacterium]|nr:transglutaminase domain-containing protein [Verrucomicrobiae bacterium]